MNGTIPNAPLEIRMKQIAEDLTTQWAAASWYIDQQGRYPTIAGHYGLLVQTIAGAARRNDRATLAPAVKDLLDLGRAFVPLIETAARLRLPAELEAIPSLSAMHKSAAALYALLAITE